MNKFEVGDKVVVSKLMGGFHVGTIQSFHRRAYRHVYCYAILWEGGQKETYGHSENILSPYSYLLYFDFKDKIKDRLS